MGADAMQRNVLFGCCCLASLLIAGQITRAAGPQPAAQSDSGALFDRLDVNRDGQLTADEIPAEKKGLFERLLRLAGKPADGKLTRDEFVAQLSAASDDHSNGNSKSGGPTPPAAKTPADKPLAGPLGQLPPLDPERIFDRLDTKHTGKLSAADIPEGRPLIKRLVAEAEKANGGPVTKEQFVKVFKELAAKRAAGEAATGKPAGDGKPPVIPPGGGDRLIKRLLNLSKQSDGKLTKDDLPERLRGRFDKIDTNHDGVIDEAELRDWIKKAEARLSAAPGK
jgi:Ca2+-binding EF-hand superfamily protein